MDLDILDDVSDDDDDQEERTRDNFETPPPKLTIGAVLDKLPKIKNGNTIILPN